MVMVALTETAKRRAKRGCEGIAQGGQVVALQTNAVLLTQILGSDDRLHLSVAGVPNDQRLFSKHSNFARVIGSRSSRERLILDIGAMSSAVLETNIIGI